MFEKLYLEFKMSKKALLIGINYKGTSSELNGCINDAERMKAFLLTKGYKEANIRMFTDDTNKKPTKYRILKELLRLILSGASSLFFHYSGHGSWVWDQNEDEEDGKDETLVPIDYTSNGMLTDDELRGILCCVKKNQQLTCLLDMCHSSSSCDLKYNLYERNGQFSMFPNNRDRETNGKVLMWSGCMDSQTSADAYEEGRYQGAMTYAFLGALEVNRASEWTYDELMRQVRKTLKDGGYTQLPNLSSGKMLDLNGHVRI